MTFAEYLLDRSGLPSGTLMEHLNAIQGTGGGGISYVSLLDAVFINEEQPIMLDVVSDNVEVSAEPDDGSVIMEEDDIIIEIVEGDVIDVIQ